MRRRGGRPALLGAGAERRAAVVDFVVSRGSRVAAGKKVVSRAVAGSRPGRCPAAPAPRRQIRQQQGRDRSCLLTAIRKETAFRASLGTLNRKPVRGSGSAGRAYGLTTDDRSPMERTSATPDSPSSMGSRDACRRVESPAGLAPTTVARDRGAVPGDVSHDSSPSGSGTGRRTSPNSWVSCATRRSSRAPFASASNAG